MSDQEDLPYHKVELPGPSTPLKHVRPLEDLTQEELDEAKASGFDGIAIQSGGQVSKLTPNRLNDLMYNLELGCTIKHACQAVGINMNTFMRWKAQYPELAELIKQSKAKGAQSLLKRLNEKAIIEGDSRAMMWLLSVVHGYTPKKLDAAEGPKRQERAVNLQNLTPEERKNLGKLLLSMDESEFIPVSGKEQTALPPGEDNG